MPLSSGKGRFRSCLLNRIISHNSELIFYCMKLQNTPEVYRLTGYMSAMSRCLNGCNYVTWLSAKSVEFDSEIDFTGLEMLGRAGASLDSQLQAIVRLAYPESKPDLAAIADSSNGTMRRKLGQFISYVNTDDGARSLVIPKKQELARGFWSHISDCIDLEQARILEYTPALGEDDELGRFIFWGFTFLIFSQGKRQCLLLHCGAAD